METTRRIAERGLLAAMKLLEVQINLLRLIGKSSEVVRRVWVARAHSQYRAPNFFRKAVDMFGVPRRVFDKLRQGERLARQT